MAYNDIRTVSAPQKMSFMPAQWYFLDDSPENRYAEDISSTGWRTVGGLSIVSEFLIYFITFDRYIRALFTESDHFQQSFVLFEEVFLDEFDFGVNKPK